MRSSVCIFELPVSYGLQFYIVACVYFIDRSEIGNVLPASILDLDHVFSQVKPGRRLIEVCFVLEFVGLGAIRHSGAVDLATVNLCPYVVETAVSRVIPFGSDTREY